MGRLSGSVSQLPGLMRRGALGSYRIISSLAIQHRPASVWIKSGSRSTLPLLVISGSLEVSFLEENVNSEKGKCCCRPGCTSIRRAVSLCPPADEYIILKLAADINGAAELCWLV